MVDANQRQHPGHAQSHGARTSDGLRGLHHSTPTYLSLAFPSDPFDTPNMTDDSRDMTTLDRQNPPAG